MNYIFHFGVAWAKSSCGKNWHCSFSVERRKLCEKLKLVQGFPIGRTALVWLRSSTADFVQSHWVLYLLVETGKRVRNELSRMFLSCLSVCFPLLSSLHRHLRRLETDTQGGSGGWLSHCSKLALRWLVLTQRIGNAGNAGKFFQMFLWISHILANLWAPSMSWHRSTPAISACR